MALLTDLGCTRLQNHLRARPTPATALPGFWDALATPVPA